MIHSLATSGLPRAIDHGLAGFPERLAWAAEGALLRAIGPALDHPDFWRASGLTGDGFPFELSFTSADPDLRWTLDVSAHAPEGQRLRAARAALERLDADPGQEVLATLQAGLSERAFGAWVGGRHGREGDRYKLYLDWQDGEAARTCLSQVALPRPAYLPGLTVPMMAIGPGPHRYEVYYRAKPPPEALVNMLAPAGLSHRANDVRSLLETTWGHRLRDRLPGGRVGISYTVAGPGALPQVTLFLFARSLWGGDARIRDRMLAKLAEAGQDIRPYAAATRPLKAYNTARTRHGLVSLGIGESGFTWGIGVRPVVTP